jgi:hypothetical protein
VAVESASVGGDRDVEALAAAEATGPPLRRLDPGFERRGRHSVGFEVLTLTRSDVAMP